MLAKKIKVGMEVPLLNKNAYQKALDTGDFLSDSSHKDEYAKSKGYKNALLSGYLTSGYINHFLVNFFGAEWLKGGDISLIFSRPVYQHDNLTIKGTVISSEKENLRQRVTIDFWVEKDDGTKVITGIASGLIG